MASKVPLEAIPLRALQRYHQTTLNTFGDGETLVEAIGKRPGFYGPNPIAYLSLMARRQTLTLGDMEEALLNDRSLIRAGGFRTSLFLMPTEDYPIYFRALHEVLMALGMGRLRSSGFDERSLRLFARRLVESDFDRPLAHKHLAEILFPAPQKRPDLEIERLLLRKLCDMGILVRTTSRGWKGNRFDYALISHWLEDVRLISDNPEPARNEVVRRYLRTYGPSRLEDIVWWTGLFHSDVRRALDQFGRELVKFPVDGLGEGLVALRETVEAVRKHHGETSGRILFLPLWDPYPLGWRDRTRVVEPGLSPWVYDPAGNATSVVVEDGRVIGLWQFRDGDSITLEFHVFEPYANRLNALRLSAEEHGAALAKVAGAKEVRVIERALPRPLAERPATSFLWPLGKEPILRMAGDVYTTNPMDRRSAANPLRSKFLDDERLVRAVEAEAPGRAVPREVADEEGTLLAAEEAEEALAADASARVQKAESTRASKKKSASATQISVNRKAATKATKETVATKNKKTAAASSGATKAAKKASAASPKKATPVSAKKSSAKKTGVKKKAVAKTTATPKAPARAAVAPAKKKSAAKSKATASKASDKTVASKKSSAKTAKKKSAVASKKAPAKRSTPAKATTNKKKAKSPAAAKKKKATKRK